MSHSDLAKAYDRIEALERERDAALEQATTTTHQYAKCVKERAALREALTRIAEWQGTPTDDVVTMANIARIALLRGEEAT